ncbi:MAG: adenylate kinase [Acidobacteria bacterium]|nr:adenylate kinase [Acidobacteriota bacterium]
MNVVMLGPPGAGKGTQASRLARIYGVPKISTGDILRDSAAQGTELGLQAKARIDLGHLVSDAVAIAIVRDRLSRQDVAKGFILDGFPRTVGQAEALDAMMDGRGPLTVLHVVVPAQVLVDRLHGRRVCAECGTTADPATPDATTCAACGGQLIQRADDDDGVVRNRLRIYEQQTEPLVDYYKARPTFFRIDGNQAPDVVASAMQLSLASVMAVVQGDGR